MKGLSLGSGPSRFADWPEPDGVGNPDLSPKHRSPQPHRLRHSSGVIVGRPPGSTVAVVTTPPVDESPSTLTTLLGRVEAASGVLERLSALDALDSAVTEAVRDAVSIARAERWSWDRIGSALGGRSKQAVQRRFRQIPAPPPETMTTATALADGSTASITSTPSRRKAPAPWVVSLPGGRPLLHVRRQQ